jgi:hypothetical protein
MPQEQTLRRGIREREQEREESQRERACVREGESERERERERARERERERAREREEERELEREREREGEGERQKLRDDFAVAAERVRVVERERERLVVESAAMSVALEATEQASTVLQRVLQQQQQQQDETLRSAEDGLPSADLLRKHEHEIISHKSYAVKACQAIMLHAQHVSYKSWCLHTWLYAVAAAGRKTREKQRQSDELAVCLASDRHRQLFVLVLLSLARAFHRWSHVVHMSPLQ